VSDSKRYVDAETERFVLGTLLHGGVDVPELGPEDFGVEIHRQIWTSISRVAREVELGPDSVTQDLMARGQLESVGGMSMLMDLHALVERGMPLAGFTRILKEKSAIRRMVRRIQQIDSEIALHGLNGNAIQIADAAREIADLAGTRGTGFGIENIKTVADYSGTSIEYVYPGMLAIGTVNLLTGDAGSGKTSYATFIAHQASAERPVLYLDRENPLPVKIELLNRLGVSDGGNLKIWGGWCEREPPGPDSATLLSWVKACEPKPLLIWDSLISFHTSGDENDAGETRRYMQGYRRLADLGATVLALHHSGKGESTKDYRGSSDIKASIDTGWHLANFGEGRLERLRLRAFKCRFAVPSDLILTYAEGRFTSDATNTVRTVTELLIDLLKAHPGIKAADFQALARDKGLGRDRARQFLESGVEAHRIRQDKGDHGAKLHTWRGAESDGK